MVSQTQRDLQEIRKRLDAMRNSIGLIETQTTALKTDISTITEAVLRIEFRHQRRQ